MSTETKSPKLWTSMREMPSNMWQSLFRNPLPHSDLERSQTSFTNFFLHIHPVKVHQNTLRPLYTLGLGLMSFFLFLILVVTGILLMFYYASDPRRSNIRSRAAADTGSLPGPRTGQRRQVVRARAAAVQHGIPDADGVEFDFCGRRDFLPRR